MPGVRSTAGIIGKPMKIRHGDGGWDSYIIGFEPGKPGGPVRMKKGSAVPGDGEIIIDDVLARTAGLDLGDTITAGRRELRVSGISAGGNLVLAQLSFVNRDEGRLLVGFDGVANFVLVQAEPGRTGDVVEAVGTRLPGVTAIDAETFAANSQDVLQRSILPILLVIVLLAVIVGTIVVGLTVYTAVVEKEREFGILKALGVPGYGLLRVVFEQSLVCGLAGYAAGVVLAMLTGWLAGLAIPQVTTDFRPADLALILAAAALMSLVAGLIPMQRVIRVDALSVFKA
jgi:putative ABC transport system permease protein